MKRAAMWVFWSPRNAIVTAVAIAAVVVVAISATAGGGEPHRATPAPATSSTTTTATPDPSRVPRPSNTSTTKAAPTTAAGEQDEATDSTAQAQVVSLTARLFTEVWLLGRTGVRADWLASLRGVTVPAFMPFVSATPPEAIPDATVKSITEPDMGDGIGTVTVTLSDGTTFDLDVIGSGKRWGVSSMTPR